MKKRTIKLIKRIFGFIILLILFSLPFIIIAIVESPLFMLFCMGGIVGIGLLVALAIWLIE